MAQAQDWSGFEEVTPTTAAPADWSAFEEVAPAAAKPAAEPSGPSLADKAIEAGKRVLTNMAEPFQSSPTTVMAEQDGRAASGPARTTPAAPEARAKIQRQYEAATSEARAQMLQRQDWQGDLARQIDQQYQQADQKTAGLPTAQHLDSRRESRVARGLAQGMTPDTAAMTATSQAAAGVDAPVGSVKPVEGAPRPEDFPSDEAYDTAMRGEAAYSDVLGAGAKRAYAGLGRGYMGMAKWAGSALGVEGLTDFADAAAQKYQGDWDAAGAEVVGRIPTDSFKELVAEVAPSAIQQMPGILASGLTLALTKNPVAAQSLLSAAVLTPMGVQVFGESYLEGEKAGLSLGQNTVYSLGKAAAEVIPERISLGALFKLLGSTKNGVAQWIGAALGQQATEHATEQVTTLTQFALDKIYTQPELTLKDLQDQMVQTFKATALQAPVLALTGMAGHAAGRAIKPKGDLTTGVEFTRGADEVAAELLNPARAQMQHVGPANQTLEVPNGQAPAMDAGGSQGERADTGGSAGLAPGGGAVAGEGSPVAGAPVRSSEPGASVGDAQPVGDAALTPAPADPLSAAVLELEEVAFSDNLEEQSAAPSSIAEEPLPEVEAAPAPVVQLRPDGTAAVAAAPETVADLMESLGVPKPATARTAGGSTLVGATAAADVEAAVAMAYPAVKYTRGDLANVSYIAQHVGVGTADVALVSPQTLWARNDADQRGTRLDGPAAAFLAAGVQAFGGRRLVFFEPRTEAGAAALPGGSIMSGDGSTIYLNVRGAINPVSELVHEATHSIRTADPQTYESLLQAITTVTEGRAAPILDVSDQALLEWATKDYFAANQAVAAATALPDLLQTLGWTRDRLIEEMVADANGFAANQKGFWPKVFRELARTDAGALQKLRTVLRAASDQIRQVLGRGANFPAVQRYINDLEGLINESSKFIARGAASKGVSPSHESKPDVVASNTRVGPFNTEVSAQTTADFNTRKGKPSKVVQVGSEYFVEVDHGRSETPAAGAGGNTAAQPVRTEGVGAAEAEVPGSAGVRQYRVAGAADARPSYGVTREGAVAAVGTHYSRAERRRLSGAYYGTGLKGAEAERLENADPELRHRVHFYIDQGKGVRPEAGVGSHAHEVKLENLYDLNADPLNVLSRDTNATELAILQAGFDGYLVRDFMPGQGAAVLVGAKHSAVPVIKVGDGAQPANGQTIAPPVLSTEKQMRQRLLDLKGVPGGEVSARRWGDIVAGLDEELHAEMAKTGVFDSDAPMYRSELAAKYVRAARGEVMASPQRTLERENTTAVTVGSKPGEFGWSPAAKMAASLEQPDVDPKALVGGAAVPPFVGPTQRQPNLVAVGEAVRKILSAKGARDVVRDITGAEIKGVTQIHGSWEGKPEVSLVLTGDMNFEQADEVSKLLGWAFAQDATVAAQPWHEEVEDQIEAILISQNKVLSDRQLKTLSAAAREAGLDYSTTVDGRGVKFLHFGDTAGLDELMGQAARIAKAAGLKEVTHFHVRSNLNEADTYLSGRSGSALRQARDQDGAAGPSDLFRRAVDRLLVPYAKAVGAEGYRFAPERFGARFGLTEAEVDYIVSALRPRSGKALSTVGIVTGEESLSPPTSDVRGRQAKVTKADLLWALQNRTAQLGFIQPGDYSDTARKILADSLADEVIYNLGREEGKNAVGWYDRALHEAKTHYEEVYPELRADQDREMLFDAMLGIASQGNDVYSNATFAGRMYHLTAREGLTIGQATKALEGTFGKQTVAVQKNYYKLERLLDVNGYDAARKFFNTRGTVSEIRAILKADPKLYGVDGKPLTVKGAKEQIVTGWSVFGPKIGSFINNLHGDYSTLTADLWFSRTWNRNLGFVFNHNPELETAQYVKLYRAMLEEARTGKGRDVVGMTPEQINEWAADPESLVTFARETHIKREAEYKEIEGEAVTPLRQAAQNLLENRTGPTEIPRTDRERYFQQTTIEAVQRIVRRKTGINITIADIQAVLWYHEKDMFRRFGVGDSKAEAADYADAARRFVERYNSGDLFFVEKPKPRYILGTQGSYLRGEPLLSPQRSALGFYSQLERAVAGVPDRIATQPAPQWKLWLASNASKLGVKADEIQWSGINEWLDLQGKRKVSKDEVGEYLSRGGVQVEEVRKGVPDPVEAMDFLVGRGLATYEELAENYDPDEVVDFAEEYGFGQVAQYDSYTVPGGKAYREVLLTLQEPQAKQAARRRLAAIADEMARSSGASEEYYRELHAERARLAEELTARDYQSNHWRERNILAHVRLDDRVDTAGRRVLFVNEIQSDWGQDGKKKGFGSVPQWGIQNARGLRPVRFDTRAEAEAEAREYSEIHQMPYEVVEVGVRDGVPAAPFVTDTKSWVGLAFKRIVTLAAEEGYDAVAIINGQQAADLYDLSKQVKEVAYNKGTKALRVLGKDGREVFNGRKPMDELSDFLGKEVADKIAEGGNFVQLTGLDLKVGGEGMRAFYDKIVPQVARDVLKKVGGQVGTIEVAHPGSGKHVIDYQDRFEVWRTFRTAPGGHRDVVGPDYASEEEARAAADRLNGKMRVGQLGFTIPAEMREGIQAEGLPMFSPRRTPVPDNAALADAAAADVGLRFSPRREPLDLAAWGFTPDARMSPPRIRPPQTAPAASWVAPDVTKWDDFVYKWQNKLVDLKAVQEAIGLGNIEDRFNPYLTEELYHGRAAYRVEHFMQSEVEPLMKAMKAYGITPAEFESYLHARHAPERNAAMKLANPNQAELDQLVQDADLDLQQLEQQRAAAAGNTFALDGQIRSAQARLAALRAAKPYRGTEAERSMLSGMSDADAAQIISAAHGGSKAAAYKALARRIDDFAAQTRAELVAYGLETQDTVDALAAAYDYYVPLHRDMETADLLGDTGFGTGAGYSVRGSKLKRATGSLREVEHILANLFAAREQAIVRGEKNRVALSLYGLALQNPNPGFWAIVKPGSTSRKALRNELLALGLNPTVVDSMIANPTEPRLNERTGLVEYRVNPMLAQQPTVLAVRVAGQDRLLVMSPENPRAVRLAMALKNADSQVSANSPLGGALMIMGKGTRYFSSINTQYNPIFGIKNFIRDVQGAALNLSTTPLKGQEAAVLAGIPGALRGIWRTERGRSGTNWSQLFDDFREQGAMTGYRDMFAGIEDRSNKLARITDPTLFDRVTRSYVMHLLSDYNTAIENGVRLAAYKVGLDAGLSKMQAASIAKNLTVNFNRKGQVSREASAAYAFFNAAVQGTGRIWETLKGPRGRKIIAGGVGLGVVQALIGAAMMGDDWDKIPEFVRERNLIIPIGRDKGEGNGGREGWSYVTIPLALGFHALPHIGRTVTEAAIFRDKLGERLLHLTAGVIDATNPLGSGQPATMWAPTVLKPTLELWGNENAFGRPIAREDISGLDPTPGHTRATRNASTVGKGIAWGINAATGGDDYVPGLASPTPDQIDYIFGTLTGGVGRETLKAYQTVEGLITGDKQPSNRVPLVGVFYGQTNNETSIRAEYYSAIRDINVAENKLKGLAADGKDAGAWIDSHPEAGLGKVARDISSRISKIGKVRATLGTSAEDKALKKRLDQEVLALQSILIDRHREAKGLAEEGAKTR